MTASRKRSRRRKSKVRGKDRRRKLRALIVRDGLVCYLCGGALSLDAGSNTDDQISIEHKVPTAEGGPNDLTNLRLAHRGCNSRHGGLRTRPGWNPGLTPEGRPEGAEVG